MNAIQCACGLRIECGNYVPMLDDLVRLGHDPVECSRRIGYEGRFEGRREMVEAAMEHLASRRSLSGPEIAEIRREFATLVGSLPLRRVSS